MCQLSSYRTYIHTHDIVPHPCCDQSHHVPLRVHALRTQQCCIPTNPRSQTIFPSTTHHSHIAYLNPPHLQTFPSRTIATPHSSSHPQLLHSPQSLKMKFLAILFITLLSLLHAHVSGSEMEEPMSTPEACSLGPYTVNIERRGAGQKSKCKPGKNGLALFIDVDDGCDTMMFKATVCRPKNIRKRARKIISCVKRKLKRCAGKPVRKCALRRIQICLHPKRPAEIIM